MLPGDAGGLWSKGVVSPWPFTYPVWAICPHRSSSQNSVHATWLGVPGPAEPSHGDLIGWAESDPSSHSPLQPVSPHTAPSAWNALSFPTPFLRVRTLHVFKQGLVKVVTTLANI